MTLTFFLPKVKGHFQGEASRQGCQMAYFQTKNPYLGKFGRSFNGMCWYISWPFGIFCDHFVPFLVIWYIFPVLVCCTNKNLATLLVRQQNDRN
jgi:hypothetical protein